VQDRWCRQLGPVAVVRADRFREPGELPPGSCTQGNECTIVEHERLPGQGRVVLAGTRRPRRAVDGDVDLVDGVELAGQLSRHQAGQSGRHPGTHDQRHAGADRAVGFGDHRLHVGDPIADRHHSDPPLEERNTGGVVWRRVSQDREGDVVEEGCRRDVVSTGVDLGHGPIGQHRSVIDDPATDDSVADHGGTGFGDAAHSGRSIGCHPPC
jgi:hypothetical protein